MSSDTRLQSAKFGKAGDPDDKLVPVMFNPASIKITVSNKLADDDEGGKGKKKDTPKPSVTKMETELVFDMTDDGNDVRDRTRFITQMALSTQAKAGGAVTTPPKATLVWGTFAFDGMIEALTETLDFWSAEGIPLRSTIQLTLVALDGDGSYFSFDGPAVTANVLGTAPPNGALMTAIATLAGDVNAARAIGAANGVESLRFGSGSAVAVGAGVKLQAAAGFSAGVGFSAGAGIGISAGVGIGGGAGAGFGIGAVGGAAAGFSAGAGIGLSAGAGFSAGASAGIGASAGAGFTAGAGAGAGFGASAGAGAGAGFAAGGAAGFGATAGASAGWSASAGWGASASAGVSAGSGAFAGLGPSKSMTLSAQLDPGRLLDQSTTTAVGSGSRFDVTGRLITSGPSGLSANVAGGSFAAAGVRVW